MNQIQQLVEALQRGNLALFLGADLPQAVTGLPSRADLARGLAHRHDVDEALSLAGVAQRVARGGQRFAFTDYLRTQLDAVGRSSQPFHQRLVALVAEHAVAVLITTAYDDLLERAFQQAGVAFNRVVRGSDVPFLDPGRPTLVKLYGDVQQPDTLVVTEDDHLGLWRDRDKEGVLDEVRDALRRNTVLFLGYNLADPDFALLWREVLDRAGRFARTAYAVWPGLPEEEAQVWRDRRIEILETDPLGILGGAGALVAPPPGAEQTEIESVQVPPGGDVYYIRTEGGAVVIGGVQVEGGDFVGRDQEIHGGPTPPSPPSRERGQSANHEAC